MYHAIIDNSGMPLETGLNYRNKEDIKEALEDLQEPQFDSVNDFKLFCKMDLSQQLAHLGYRLDESQEPYHESEEF